MAIKSWEEGRGARGISESRESDLARWCILLLLSNGVLQVK
jgi:hypothetical protein